LNGLSKCGSCSFIAAKSVHVGLFKRKLCSDPGPRSFASAQGSTRGYGRSRVYMCATPQEFSRRQLLSGVLLLHSTLMVPSKDALAADKPFDSVRLGVGDRSLVVPPMGIGAWSWGDQDVWGYGGYDKDFSDDSIQAAFEASVKAGVTFFDTAEVPRAPRSVLGCVAAGRPPAGPPAIAHCVNHGSRLGPGSGPARA
jgi:hypothetical protein